MLKTLTDHKILKGSVPILHFKPNFVHIVNFSSLLTLEMKSEVKHMHCGILYSLQCALLNTH